MTITARYMDADHTKIAATIDGVEWHGVRLSDDTELNRRVYEWVQAGGIIAPYEPPPLTQDDYQSAIQAHVDSVAQARNYDNGVSCAGYAASSVAQWSNEATTFIAWRDAVWTYAFTELLKVENQERTQPTISEFIAELPTIEWPS